MYHSNYVIRYVECFPNLNPPRNYIKICNLVKWKLFKETNVKFNKILNSFMGNKSNNLFEFICL